MLTMIAALVALAPVAAELRVEADAAPYPRDRELSRLVSESRLIVVATPRVPPLMDAAKGYADIPLDDTVALKASSGLRS